MVPLVIRTEPVEEAFVSSICHEPPPAKRSPPKVEPLPRTLYVLVVAVNFSVED